MVNESDSPHALNRLCVLIIDQEDFELPLTQLTWTMNMRMIEVIANDRLGRKGTHVRRLI